MHHFKLYLNKYEQDARELKLFTIKYIKLNIKYINIYLAR